MVERTGTLMTGPSEASVKVRHANELRQKAGALVSEGITPPPNGDPVPEPSTLGLAGMGLVLLAACARRARRR